MARLIGLLGGTFDPFHYGHLAVARELCAGLELAGVRMILNAAPPHRAPPACPVQHRLSMLELALAGEAGLVVDTRELHRTGPSYSLWTLRSLREEFPDASFCWIVGADAWLGLTSWYHWYELSSLAHFVVVKRPGWSLSAEQARSLSRNTGELARRTAGAAVLVDGPGVDVSASDIRRRIAAGQDVSDSLPAPVWGYIRRERLYGYHPSNRRQPDRYQSNR
ncbi:MAG: nicotinate-nucleotide adenylyltransferase [Arenicellales bacterium]